MWVLHLIKYRIHCFLIEAIWAQIFPEEFWRRKFFYLLFPIHWFFQHFSSKLAKDATHTLKEEKKDKFFQSWGFLFFNPPTLLLFSFIFLFSWSVVISHWLMRKALANENLPWHNAWNLPVNILSPTVILLFFQSSRAHPFKSLLCDSESEHEPVLVTCKESAFISSLDCLEKRFLLISSLELSPWIHSIKY